MVEFESLDSFSGSTSKPRPDPGPISLSEVFELGGRLRQLRETAESASASGVTPSDQATREGILELLEEIHSTLQSSNFDSSVTADIFQLSTSLSEKYEADEELDSDDAERLEKKIVAWEHLLRADLEREQRVPAGDTGLLEVEGLLNSPEKLFSNEVWRWLDTGPKSDIREACVTLSVDCPTSSVILSLRALEHCLRVWYNEEMEEELQRGWGKVIGQLIDEFLSDSSSNDVMEQLGELPPVLSNIYYLKEKRNEVNHPEKSPNSQEARRTLMIVAATITDIHREIHYKDRDEVLESISEIDFEGQSTVRALDELLRELDQMDQYENGVPIETIMVMARQKQVEESEISDEINGLLMSGRAYEPTDGVLKPI